MPGHQAKLGWGVGIFKADINDFWATINNGDRHAQKTPVDYAQVVSGVACMDQRRLFMTLPLPLIADRWWVVQTSTNPRVRKNSSGHVREMSWKNEPHAETYLTPQLIARTRNKIQVTFIRGAWVLIELEPGYVLGEYHTWSEAGGDLPEGLAAPFLSNSIVKTMRVMERMANSKEQPCLSRQ